MPVGHCVECDKGINRGANLTEYKVSPCRPFTTCNRHPSILAWFGKTLLKLI